MAKCNSSRSGFWDDFLGGFFDFDGDGNEDLCEGWIGYQILEEGSWRDLCEDGLEYDVFPEDYETEDEYEDALSEAKANCRDICDAGLSPQDFESRDNDSALYAEQDAWKDNCQEGSAYNIDPDEFYTEGEYNEAIEEARQNGNSPPAFAASLAACSVEEAPVEIKEEDYPNKRRYNAACILADEFLLDDDDEYERREKACCQFINSSADTILAANYLVHDAGFLYAQAIKDNFKLPVSLPNEDESRELELYQILGKIARRDIALSLEIWNWCLQKFMPYAQYDVFADSDMSASIIDQLYRFPAGYKSELIRYMSKTPDFMKNVIEANCDMAEGNPELIAIAIKEGLSEVAQTMFKSALTKAGKNWRRITDLTKGVIDWSQDYEEVETVEYFRDNMLPLVKENPIGMVRDEISEWESSISEYIEKVETRSEKYAYSRKNAWRSAVPDGKKYGLDPRNYSNQQEYLNVLRRKMYGWRDLYKERDTLGLSVDDFETRDEYQKAYTALRQEKERIQRERIQQQNREALDDKSIYTICGVCIFHHIRPYHYLSDDPTLKIGDTVIVPVSNNEAKGTVVSVGQYLRVAAPFPVDRMKAIKCRVQNKATSDKKELQNTQSPQDKEG